MKFFKRRKPLSKTELSNQLLELSKQTEQFVLRSSPDTDFIIERNIVDAEGYGITGLNELKKIYRAYFLLYEEKHEARYNEETQESSKSISASSTGLGFSAEKKFFRGKIYTQKEFSEEWSFRKRGDPTSFGKVYDYSFDVKKIREPIKKLIENAGWKFKQVVFKKDATYKK